MSWTDEYDDVVWQYVVKRRDVNDATNKWKIVGTLFSDREADGELIVLEDELDSAEPRQYVYRVDMMLSNLMGYKAEKGKEILSSNVLICIDPGHYVGKNTVEGELSYGYAEGDFTLDIALELQQVLKEKYGIDVYLTRTSEHINIHGYRDASLDASRIALRGMRAAYKDSDLFVSLHTNANIERAHGNPTCLQPIGMNKPIILVNQIGCEDEMTISVSNSIGTNLAKANYALRTASVEEFILSKPGQVEEWTGKKNDMLDVPGTAYYRLNAETGADYYGVLRGAAVVNKPGIIIEHGFHTVPEMRKEAMEGNLKNIWANIDAYGIAYGFGFETELEISDLTME
ncbi:MAG: N-acetylmuramoyl-L-alanine amidase [Agathobacter sp.]|nr:N-acetylmuramoyl-L-alanine amidase [Agathobacter sp.]